MKRILSALFLLIGTCSFSQTFNQQFANIVDQCNYDSILEILNEFEALGVKEIGTAELDNTLAWLTQRYTEYGYTDIQHDPFSYFGQNTANLVVTKTGCKYPDTYVIIDGHYDTKNGPGTNDNGSGTAILLEIARLLVDVETEYSIKFIHFSGEEDGLRGSQHYVDNVVIPQNMDIKILFNIDEVGGVNGMTNDIIVCERDEGNPPGNNAQSAAMTQFLANCVGLYSNLSAEIDYAYSSDYMPFEDNGEIITGFFEKNYSPHAHTTSDILSNMDVPYVHEICKAAMGGMLHFSEAKFPVSITESSCGDYTSPSGNYTWTSSGMYTDTIDVNGCDSIIHIDLTVGTLDNTITVHNGFMVANQNNATYQWIDCNNGNSPISGATDQTFYPTVNGNFAVEVTQGNCTETSNCLPVYLNLDHVELMKSIHLFPNPVDKLLHIQSPYLVQKIEVLNVLGATVYSSASDVTSVNLSHFPEGIYHLRITTNVGQVTKPISVQH